MSLQPQPNFHAKHWHHRPAWQAHWHALDTHFDNGQAFLDTLLAWKESHQASSTLFYTAFAERAPVNLIPELRQHCFGLFPGIHRISFEQSKVHLTLCIGPVAQNLKEIDFAADSIFISNLSGYEPRQFARLCKLGSFIHLEENPFIELNQFKATSHSLSQSLFIFYLLLGINPENILQFYLDFHIQLAYFDPR
jgi:hypothetical protein